MFGNKKPVLPAQVQAKLSKEENRCPWEVIATGGYLLASLTHLVHIADDLQIQRLQWCEISHSAWDGDTNLLTVSWTNGTPDTVWNMDGGQMLEFSIAMRQGVESALVHFVSRDYPQGRVQAAVHRKADGSLFVTSQLLGVAQPSAEELLLIEAVGNQARDAVGLSAC